MKLQEAVKMKGARFILTVTHIRWQIQPFSVWQSQHFIIVQNTVEILHPLGINVSIKDNPLTLVDLTTNIVYDPAR